MNKKLVAVAVAGVLAAPLAAEAQTANVTLYGRLNLTMEAVSGRAVDPNIPATGNQIQNRTVYRVSSNSSRLGVRGSEALGGGLSAIFQIESNVSADTGGGLLGTRETFVGLQGPWGTFKVGNFLAPYDDIHPIFGNVPTLTTSILSTAALWAQASQSKGNGGFDARLGNSIRYDSPNMKGFVGSFQLSSLDASSGQGGVTYGNQATQQRHAYVMSMGAYYTNGPFKGGVAYENNQKVRGQGLDDWALSAAANWNFGFMKLGGVYERLDYDTATGNLKRDFWGVSATVPVGPGELYGFYGNAGDGKGNAANGTTIGQLVKGGGTGASQWEISYTYALSKRTLAYTGFVQTRNDQNAFYNFNINPYNVAPDANASGFVVGLVHFF
ncbi:MAG: porin [Burkholderiales bacterium]|nr:porin [Burkholderiales bacterium]